MPVDRLTRKATQRLRVTWNAGICGPTAYESTSRNGKANIIISKSNSYFEKEGVGTTLPFSAKGGLESWAFDWHEARFDRPRASGAYAFLALTALHGSPLACSHSTKYCRDAWPREPCPALPGCPLPLPASQAAMFIKIYSLCILLRSTKHTSNSKFPSCSNFHADYHRRWAVLILLLPLN